MLVSCSRAALELRGVLVLANKAQTRCQVGQRKFAQASGGRGCHVAEAEACTRLAAVLAGFGLRQADCQLDLHLVRLTREVRGAFHERLGIEDHDAVVFDRDPAFDLLCAAESIHKRQL